MSATRCAVFATTVPVTLRKFHIGTVQALQDQGFVVTLVSSPGTDLDAASELTGSPSQALTMARGITPRDDLVALSLWISLLRRIRPDTLIAGTPKCALLAMTAGALTRIPRRVYVCGGLRHEGERGLVRVVLVLMERIAMGAATEVVVNSHSLLTEVVGASLARSRKVRQILPGSSHGVDSAYFAPREPDRALIASLGLDPDLPVLGFVGRLTRDKGVDTLIEAAHILDTGGLAVQLLVVGPQDEPDSVNYLERLRHSGLATAVVGATDDVRPYFAVMTVHVLPSFREGFPNVVLEAAAMGVPTVTTTATGCRDAVLDGETGLLFPTRDSDALADALTFLLSNMTARDRLGRLGRQWVEESFRPHSIARQITSPAPARAVSQETAEQEGDAVAPPLSRHARERMSRRGRERISRLTPFLVLAELVLKLLPDTVTIWLFKSVRGRSGVLGRGLRYVLLRKHAGTCGEVVDIKENVYIFGVQMLNLGSRVSIHPLTYIDATGGIEIGNDVSIAHNVTIMSTTHVFSKMTEPIRDQGVKPKPVKIGDDVWIGAGARIVGGIVLGGGSVIAAGAVVTHDVPAMSVVGGVPARVLSTRSSGPARGDVKWRVPVE